MSVLGRGANSGLFVAGGVAVVAVVITLALFISGADTQSPTPSPLNSIDDRTFNDLGLKHSIPSQDVAQSVAISAKDAEQRLKDTSLRIDQPLKEPPALINVDLEQTFELRGPYKGPAWALSLQRAFTPLSGGMPTGDVTVVSRPAPTVETSYFLVLLNPHSGEILYIAEGTQPRTEFTAP